jgi:hypothetical protein
MAGWIPCWFGQGEGIYMVALLRPQQSSEQGSIDRDYRVIGWWGLALAAFGLAALVLAMTSLLPD